MNEDPTGDFTLEILIADAQTVAERRWPDAERVRPIFDQRQLLIKLKGKISMIIVADKKKDLARRYYANVIDYLIILIVTVVYIFFAGDQDPAGTYRVTGFKALLIPLIWFLYFPVSEAIFQQTVGKKALNLYVIDLNGIPPSIVQTFLRRMLDMLEVMFLGIPAILTINYSERNQRIGDMLAGTTVIRTDALCRFCGAELDLTVGEVINDSFKCPGCGQVN